ncbi:hypothetical protein LCGC14_1543030 [marine sediment metagenome]|uniref:Tyr recombinase domain-containing protein n=1 Tax=marine sediment metagenome TaxID=412755 RepID=A0A0F9ISJ5_9ZZZZ
MIEIKNINLTEVFGREKIDKWRNSYPIFQDENVQLWITHKIEKFTRSGKEPVKFSVTGYLKHLNDYCEFYECENPSELLEEKIDARNKRLLNYLSQLLRNGVNEVSVKNSIQSRIKSFYSDRGSPLSDGLQTASSGLNVNEIILDRHTIQKILVKLHRPEYRLILKTQALLGLRISDLLEKIVGYKVERYKDHHFIRGFNTMKEGVKINYLFFPTELSNLIESIGGIKLVTKSGNPIKSYDVLERIKSIVEEMGLEGNIKTHSFRKYFSSQVRKCREVDIEFKEHLMGHKGQNLSRSYNNNLKDIEWFYEQWLKIEPYICIECQIYDKTSEEIKVLKQENFELRGDIKKMKDQIKEIYEAQEIVKQALIGMGLKEIPKLTKKELEKKMQ